MLAIFEVGVTSTHSLPAERLGVGVRVFFPLGLDLGFEGSGWWIRVWCFEFRVEGLGF
jgi:hypothetical protein